MRRSIWGILAAVLLAWGAAHYLPKQSLTTTTQPRVSTMPSVTSPASQTTPQPASQPSTQPALPLAYPAFLPREAHDVLDRIVRGQPHPYPQDGTVFGNRERLLPRQPIGYYHEYTVPTPGERHRGARRIITGGSVNAGDIPREYWYTADHYRSFRAFQWAATP